MSPLSSIGDTACAAPPRGASPVRGDAEPGNLRAVSSAPAGLGSAPVGASPRTPAGTACHTCGAIFGNSAGSLRSGCPVFSRAAFRSRRSFSLPRFLSCESACRAVVLFRRSVPDEGRCTVLRRSRGLGRAGRSFPFLRSVALWGSFSLLGSFASAPPIRGNAPRVGHRKNV